LYASVRLLLLLVSTALMSPVAPLSSAPSIAERVVSLGNAPAAAPLACRAPQLLPVLTGRPSRSFRHWVCGWHMQAHVLQVALQPGRLSRTTVDDDDVRLWVAREAGTAAKLKDGPGMSWQIEVQPGPNRQFHHVPRLDHMFEAVIRCASCSATSAVVEDMDDLAQHQYILRHIVAGWWSSTSATPWASASSKQSSSLSSSSSSAQNLRANFETRHIEICMIRSLNS